MMSEIEDTVSEFGIYLLCFQAFYKQSKKRFDDDSIFKERAQKAVVSLQVNNWNFGVCFLFYFIVV